MHRLKEQAQNIPRLMFEPVQRYFYDLDRVSKLNVWEGVATKSEKFCVLLIYQPGALPTSLLRTCEYMSAKGYNVIVVANGGILDDQRDVLLRSAWIVIERPNFGYDFGGYRDAILFLQDQRIYSAKLILMNDSIWFPMWSKTKVIENLERSPFDLTGLLLHVPSRNEAVNDQQRMLRKRKLTEHVESYFTMISQACFDSEAFIAFWKKYPQTNSKLMTIKRGEVGFSKAMNTAGFSIGGLTQRSSFINDISEKSDDFLSKTLKYAAYSDKAFEDECQELLALTYTADWRPKVLDHIVRVVEARRFNASFCWATEQLYGTTFVKKHPGRLFQLGRERFLVAVDRGDLPCDNQEALAELRTMVKVVAKKL